MRTRRRGDDALQKLHKDKQKWQSLKGLWVM